MAEERVQRRLAAILAADVVGYSRLMRADEAGTRARFNAHLHGLIDPAISRLHGRTVKTMGDGLLVEFASVVDAVQCAIDIQKGMEQRNVDEHTERRIVFRVGINVGDVMIEDDDIHGDGVNVAARLQALATPGGICISQQAFDQIETKLDLAYEDWGERSLKNIDRPVHVFAIDTRAETARAAKPRSPTRKTGRSHLVPLVGGGVGLVVVAALGTYFLLSTRSGSLPGGGGVAEPAVAIGTPSPPAPRSQPAIAVLPFDNLSGDPSQDYFSDGMTEDLITDLSQVSGLLVIARNSTFSYKGRAMKVQQVGRELGVQYVLEGSVRKSGNRVRINAQLVDARDGHHLWAERFDREITDVFALQDDVVKRIVSQLAVELTEGEQERLSRTARVDPEAYDVLLRGLERFRRFTQQTNREARAYFVRAAELDPRYARAHADVALTHAIDVEYGWSKSREDSIQAAHETVQKALTLDKTNSYANFALGMIYLVQRRWDDAIAVGRGLTTLYPNYADGFAQLAQTLVWAGEPEESLVALRKAMRINPHHGLFYVWMVGQDYLLMERYDDAIAEFRKVVQKDPGFPWAHLSLAAAYGLTGRIEEAEWEGSEFLALQPDFTLAHERRRVLFRRPEHRDRYLEGLRKAGLPE